MNTQKENSMNKADRSDSRSKVNHQQDKNQSGNKSDTSKHGVRTAKPKFDKEIQTDDKPKKDIGSEHQREKQMPDPKEFTKKDNKDYKDKSERI